MRADFVDNLLNKVKFAGLGESKHQEIRDKIANNEPSFDVLYEPNFKHKTEALAHITRDKVKDDYYFNTYDVTVKKEGNDPVKQTIYTENPQKDNEGQWLNSTITLKEAYNMLDVDAKGMGRSVLKDFVPDKGEQKGQRYQAWVRFDFTRKYDSGNYPILKTNSFDLDTYLKNSKIKDIDDSNIRKNLMGKLEKGEEVNVTEGGVTRGIVVNPQFKNAKFVPAFVSKPANEQKQSEANNNAQNNGNQNAQNQKTGQGNNQANQNRVRNATRKGSNRKKAKGISH